MTHAGMANDVFANLHLGSEISVQSKIKREKEKTYVIGFYPNFILCQNEKGFTECFLYYDVWMMLHGGAALEERCDE